MLTNVLHANWSDGALHIWAESALAAQRAAESSPSDASTSHGAAPRPVRDHPFAADAGELTAIAPAQEPTPVAWQASTLTVFLPAHDGRPLASPSLAHAIGHTAAEDGSSPALLAPVRVASLKAGPGSALALLDAVEAMLAGPSSSDNGSSGAIRAAPGPSLEFFFAAGRFVRWLLAQQRFVPTLVQDLSGGLRGLWQPWLADEMTSTRLARLLAAMPASARAASDRLAHEPWPILEDFLVRVCDAQCRTILTADQMSETIDARPPAEDAHVAWLTGLLDRTETVRAPGEQRPDILKRVRGWIGALDARGGGAAWRLCLRLSEPREVAALPDAITPAQNLVWTLSLALQAVESPDVILDAADIWLLPTDSAMIGSHRVDHPQELLLAELARAARVYRNLEAVLRNTEPSEMPLSTLAAYEFLREHRPALIEQGFGVLAPDWWDSPSARLGVRMQVDSGEGAPRAGSGGASASGMGLATLVNYSWRISIGQTTLSLQEFERLATTGGPLVMIGGRWVEVRPEDVKSAVEFLRENPGGQMELGRAMRLAFAADSRMTGLPVVGMDMSGWLATVFGDTGNAPAMEALGPPEGFVGSLRPYQLKGLSWLAFLDRFGLGACLADDMGLGKTIQLLAMLLHERLKPANPAPDPEIIGPTLLIAPMSVVNNWLRESKRFAPSLRVHVHHGIDRPQGKALLDAAMQADLVVTTYALAHRDRDDLESVPWRRVALDEAQNIKNPGTKQAQAIRSFDAQRRVALTGTPIENRLSELWSIMDFLNPGLLGALNDFRNRFALPIERYHDQARAKRLRALVQPFVLRRLKTDPNVISDLPEKVETKEYCYLTPEQASLYEQTVKNMLATAESAEGMHRRGVILAGLIRLKQICNHPHQFLKENDDRVEAGGIPATERSGKCTRLVEMLDEVIASGGQALIFTQFRQMGAILSSILRKELDRDVLFLHGGTTAKDRDTMIQRFQKGDGTTPIFVLSLKAGGVGLNLTGANHVFHFDRWWNPAVESQATDRAYRIGQTRTVQVHKFVVAGTLEERIDQMIEQKMALADNVLGSGEAWLTELSLSQLRDVLMLRPEAVEEEAEVQTVK